MYQSAESFFIRDGVTESASLEVLYAPLNNSDIDLAICQQALSNEVVQFFDGADWPQVCYEIFEPVLLTQEAKNGFFSKFVSNNFR
jgi:hypothetical protein